MENVERFKRDAGNSEKHYAPASDRSELHPRTR